MKKNENNLSIIQHKIGFWEIEKNRQVLKAKRKVCFEFRFEERQRQYCILFYLQTLLQSRSVCVRQRYCNFQEVNLIV